MVAACWMTLVQPPVFFSRYGRHSLRPSLLLLSLIRGAAAIVPPSSADPEAEELGSKCGGHGHMAECPVSSFELVLSLTPQSAAIPAVDGKGLEERKESGGEMAADPFSMVSAAEKY